MVARLLRSMVPCPSAPSPLMVLSTFINSAPDPRIAVVAAFSVIEPPPESIFAPVPEIASEELWFKVIFPLLLRVTPPRVRDAVGTFELPIPRLSVASSVKLLHCAVVFTVTLETRLLPLSIRQSSPASGGLPSDHFALLVQTPAPPSQMSWE